MISLLTRGESVRALVGDHVRFERGTPSMVQGSRLAVLAHWSANTRVSKSVSALVHELQSFGYGVVVSSACEADGPLEWDLTVDSSNLVVIRKPNIGHDFGSWSIALDVLPQLATAERIIIVNDSMAGPFVSLRPLLEELDRTRADVWGLTDSQQFGRHLQSYFIGFCDGVLAEPQLQRFWAGIRHVEEKSAVVLRNEIGLGRLLFEEGYVQLPAFSYKLFVKAGENPVIRGWRRLLDHGFPFLKREILRDPSVAPAGVTAPSLIRQLFGEDISEWV